ncbi:MAG: YbjN domain-containing protein [Acidimicrobiia bacterium]
MTDLFALHELDGIEARIDAWMERQRTENPAVAAVDRGEPGQRRWYVRLYGEDKDFTTIWFTLDQRTLRYETYVLPEPEENRAEVYEQALKRNHKLVGAQFSIGDEHAIFLVGALPLGGFSEAELDRIVGTVYAYVEQSFRSLLHLAFASKFTR